MGRGILNTKKKEKKNNRKRAGRISEVCRDFPLSPNNQTKWKKVHALFRRFEDGRKRGESKGQGWIREVTSHSII